MKRTIAAIALLSIIATGHGQEKARGTFVPPFTPPLTLSGNFGEIRANHFHGGLDFKTGGAIGKPVRALADGYISRIRVTNGSGHVLDVCYRNGYTTINRHLSAFMPAIARRVEQLQYKEESWEVEIVPRPDEYPVKAGQQIAWSGNTGYSFGPHLHLDVLETATGDYVDPMPFFRTNIKDTRAPKADGFLLFAKPGRGVVEGKEAEKVIAVGHRQPVEAWGEVGAAIKAYDYMDGTLNHYGVYSVVLEVDGKEVFRSTVDRFSQAENRMINSWMYGKYMKSFIDPGNTLRLLKASNGNRGWVNIDQERDYRFAYTLQDAFGNTSHYAFVVRGKRHPITTPQHREKYFFAWDRTNYLQEPGLHLVVPRGMLYDDAPLHYEASTDSDAVAFTYQLNDKPIPLQAGCELQIGLRRMPVADSTKYYIARVMPSGKTYGLESTYSDGYLKASILELATYTAAIDTVAPRITPINKSMWARTRRIVFRLKDDGSGIASYRGTIDGKFALFGRPNLTKSFWECEFSPRHVTQGRRHTVVFTVTDRCGNTSTVRESFVW
ncbi:MAG: M23 family metallopeptidase [Mediterranea sp.]|jgi:murein DD-endopeptidase MepM/ murein hydrolase activator NlpD|nr:M23 family metallopeptidase [Mediterranea sp.]